jgi:hypothetical protein
MRRLVNIVALIAVVLAVTSSVALSANAQTPKHVQEFNHNDTSTRAPTMPADTTGDALRRLASNHLKSQGVELEFSKAELALLGSLKEPTVVWVGKSSDEDSADNDPLKVKDWTSPKDRMVHGALISWLMEDRSARKYINGSGGIGLGGAIIDGISLDGVTTPVRLVLSHCLIGSLDMRYAHTSGISLTGSIVTSGLNAQYAVIGGGLFLTDNFMSYGNVDLTDAEIDGDLALTNGNFLRDDKESDSISALELTVKGDVFAVGGFLSDGIVNLTNSKVDGDLMVKYATFDDDKDVTQDKNKVADYRNGVVAIGMSVERKFVWDHVKETSHTELLLDLAKVGTLEDEVNAWPQNVSLDGFEYENFSTGSMMSRDAIRSRLKKIEADKMYSTQPYQQLANVLSKRGEENQAIDVLIAKEDQLRANGGLGWQGHMSEYVLGPLIGYGYRPFRALWPIVGFVGLGTILFSWGYRSMVLTPTDPSSYDSFIKQRTLPDHYQAFNSFIYSLETFLPLVKLGQGEHWVPNVNLIPSKEIRLFGPLSRHEHKFGNKFGRHLHWYLWLHISMGWLLTAMLVAGVTGLVHKT